jgi:hypothetical protein
LNLKLIVTIPAELSNCKDIYRQKIKISIIDLKSVERGEMLKGMGR